MNHLTEAEMNRFWRDRQRGQRKIAVFKAVVASGLLFLICGGAVLIVYALEW